MMSDGEVQQEARTETERQYREIERLAQRARAGELRGELGIVAGFRLYATERNGSPKVLAYYTYQDWQALDTTGKLGDMARARAAFLPLSRLERVVDYLEVSGKLAGTMVLFDKGAKLRMLEESTEDRRTGYPWV